MVDAKQTAQQLAASPGIREKFLKDPYAAVQQAVPAKAPLGLGILGLGVDEETKELRKEVLTALTELAEQDAIEHASARHAQRVIDQFFKAAIRNPELTFRSILAMSGLALLVGLALVVAGLVVGLGAEENTENSVIASVFGVGGVFGALGSVYTLVRRNVTLANANHAQIRLVLTGFATELGHLRALDLQGLRQVNKVNQQIREAMTAGVDLIQTHVKMEPKTGEQEPAPTAGSEQEKKPGNET